MTTTTDAAITAGVQTALAQLLAGVVPDTILANIRELADVREVKKAMEDREAVLRQVILDYMDVVKTDSIAEGGVSAHRTTFNRPGIDRNLLETRYPRAFADTKTNTPVTQLRAEVKG